MCSFNIYNKTVNGIKYPDKFVEKSCQRKFLNISMCKLIPLTKKKKKRLIKKLDLLLFFALSKGF